MAAPRSRPKLDLARLQSRLGELRAARPDVVAVAVTTLSGLVLAADAAEPQLAELLAAYGPELLQHAEATSAALAGGPAEEIVLRGPHGHLVALQGPPGVALMALSRSLEGMPAFLTHARVLMQEVQRTLNL